MTVIYEQQRQELEKYDLCREILMNARNELYLSMRFLDVAFSSLELLPDGSTKSWGCDGRFFHFHPDYLMFQYQENSVKINRGFLHQIFHCMFGHIWHQPGNLEETKKADWNLACDMATEYLIDSLQFRCVRIAPSPWRRECYRKIEEKMHVVTAQRLFGILESMDSSKPEYRRLVQEFRQDDHQFWYQPPENQSRQPNQKDWDDIREKMQSEIELFSKEASQEAGHLAETLRVENREKYDY